jgi:hypothetical protein
MSEAPTIHSDKRDIAAYYRHDYDAFLSHRSRLRVSSRKGEAKVWDQLYASFRSHCTALKKRRAVKENPKYEEEWPAYAAYVLKKRVVEDDDDASERPSPLHSPRSKHDDDVGGMRDPPSPHPLAPVSSAQRSSSSAIYHQLSSSSPSLPAPPAPSSAPHHEASSSSLPSSHPTLPPNARERRGKDERMADSDPARSTSSAQASYHLCQDERKTDSVPALPFSFAPAAGRLDRPSQKVSMQDFLRALLPKIVEAQQVLLEPFLAKFLTAQQSQLELLQANFAPPAEEESAQKFGCRGCDSLRRQVEEAAQHRRQDVVYHPSRILDSTPEHLSEVLPGVKEVWIDGDGQCALRAVAVGIWPSLGEGEDDGRVAEVRRDLLGELQRWSVGNWMNVVPGYGVRGLVVDDLGDEDRRTSYDFYVQYLSDPMHRSTHLDHAIFYLASSFYHVEFIIVALLSEGRDKSSLYHRRINQVADSCRTIVVNHSHEHYSLLDIKTSDTASLTALLRLPLQVQTSRWEDRDWRRWKANEPREEESIADDEDQSPQLQPPPPSSVPAVAAPSQSSSLSQIVKAYQEDEMDNGSNVAAPSSDHRDITRPSLPLSQPPNDAQQGDDGGQSTVFSSRPEISFQLPAEPRDEDAAGIQQDRLDKNARSRDRKARKRRSSSVAADADCDKAPDGELPAYPDNTVALLPTVTRPAGDSAPAVKNARGDHDNSVAHADDDARVQSIRSHNRFYSPSVSKSIPVSGGARKRASKSEVAVNSKSRQPRARREPREFAVPGNNRSNDEGDIVPEASGV